MLHLKWEAELFSIRKNLQRPQEEGWEQKAIKMVMLPHLEECIKILFVSVNRSSVSLVSLHLMASVQAQKCSKETLVKAGLLLLYCQGRAPGCPRVPPRKLLCFYELEVLRDEKNTVIHSFFYFHSQSREMKFDDWKARLASQRFSKERQPSVSSFHCLVCSVLCTGWSPNPQKSLSCPFIAIQCHVMYCHAVQCDSVMNLNCDCKIQFDSRSLFCRDLK